MRAGPNWGWRRIRTFRVGAGRPNSPFFGIRSHVKSLKINNCNNLPPTEFPKPIQSVSSGGKTDLLRSGLYRQRKYSPSIRLYCFHVPGPQAAKPSWLPASGTSRITPYAGQEGDIRLLRYPAVSARRDDRKEENAARWKHMPTVMLLASAPML